MFSKFTKQFICSPINFSAKFVVAQRWSSNFGKTWSSATRLKLAQSPRIVVRFRSSGSAEYFKTVLPNVPWKLGSGIVVGLCIGCATLKYFGDRDKWPNFALAKTVVKAAEKADTTVVLAPSYRKTMNFIVDIVEKVAPAVVNIESLGSQHTIFGTLISKSGGSGFIVRSDGLILTNAHVVQDSRKVRVRLLDGKTYDGTVEHFDPTADLATVKIKASNLPVMKLADSKEAKAGEIVIAMGSPLSLENSVTFGIISNTQRTLPDQRFSYIQTDAAITTGNSGGPLVNLDGEAVGINNMTVLNAPGISFAIPSCYAKEFLENAEKQESQRKSFGILDVFSSRTKRKHLGITMFALDAAALKELKMRNRNFPHVSHGILVHTIQRDSPADKAGMHPGDIITEVDNRPIYSSEEMIKIVQKSTGPLQLTIMRENEEINLTVLPEVDQD